MYHANCSFVAGSSGLWRRVRLDCPKRSNRVIRLRAAVKDGKRPSAASSLFTLILFHVSPHAFLGGNLFLSPADFQGCLSLSSSTDDKLAVLMTVYRLARLYTTKKVEVDL